MRAQASADFLITFSLAMIMFLVIINTSMHRSEAFDEKRTSIYARELADHFAAELNAVYLAGPDTKKLIELPNTLQDETPYVINVYPGADIVEVIWWTNQLNRYTAPTIAPIGSNITNIYDDVNVTYSDNVTFNPTQKAFDVNSFCVGEGYGYGICRKGVAHCTPIETSENEGNPLCTRDDGGIACCG